MSGILNRFKMAGQDKRKEVKLNVYFGPSQQTILSGYMVDLSRNGLFLNVVYPLRVNEELALIFTLPDHEGTISCRARVAWCNQENNLIKQDFPPGVGLEFVDLSQEDLIAISSFLEHHDIVATW